MTRKTSWFSRRLGYAGALPAVVLAAAGCSSKGGSGAGIPDPDAGAGADARAERRYTDYHPPGRKDDPFAPVRDAGRGTGPGTSDDAAACVPAAEPDVEAGIGATGATDAPDGLNEKIYGKTWTVAR